ISCDNLELVKYIFQNQKPSREDLINALESSAYRVFSYILQFVEWFPEILRECKCQGINWLPQTLLELNKRDLPIDQTRIRRCVLKGRTFDLALLKQFFSEINEGHLIEAIRNRQFKEKFQLVKYLIHEAADKITINIARYILVSPE